MQLLETQRLKLLLFTLELKKVTLAERARLTEMLGVAIPVRRWESLCRSLPQRGASSVLSCKGMGIPPTSSVHSALN